MLHPEPLPQHDHKPHLVELYGHDERPLVENVAQFLFAGLERDERTVIVATPEHTVAFLGVLADLGLDVSAAVADGQLTTLDANESLGKFMRNRHPDPDLFHASIGKIMEDLTAQGSRLACAYGEMVGILWTAGQVSAAIRLEQLWNDLLTSLDFQLYCAYPISVLSPEFGERSVEALLGAHTHYVPTPQNTELQSALSRGMDAVLGTTQARAVRPKIRAYRPVTTALPQAEATVLWLRRHLPEYADDIVEHVREHFGPVNVGLGYTG